MEDTEQHHPPSCDDMHTKQISAMHPTQTKQAFGTGVDQPIAAHVMQTSGRKATLSQDDQPISAQLTSQNSGRQSSQSKQASGTPDKKTDKDPFMFHGTQSQKSPGKILEIKEVTGTLAWFYSVLLSALFLHSIC